MPDRTLDPDQAGSVHRYILAHFSRTGQPPSGEEIGNGLGLDSDAVKAALGVIEARDGIHRDPATGEILAAYPFSAVPTDHVIRFDEGQSVFAMCAIDALGIPVMLDTDAIVESRCAHCRTPIRVEVQHNALMYYSPHESQVWYTSKPDGCCAAALAQCPTISFFCSSEHLAAWRGENPEAQGTVHDLASLRAGA
jgi:hypothetical protein